MLISVHERRPRLRWVERPIRVLEKMPARRQRPGALTLLIWFSACALMAYGLVTLALLARGGR